jgi:hypothetical protein
LGTVWRHPRHMASPSTLPSISNSPMSVLIRHPQSAKRPCLRRRSAPESAIRNAAAPALSHHLSPVACRFPPAFFVRLRQNRRAWSIPDETGVLNRRFCPEAGASRQKMSGNAGMTERRAARACHLFRFLRLPITENRPRAYFSVACSDSPRHNPSPEASLMKLRRMPESLVWAGRKY